MRKDEKVENAIGKIQKEFMRYTQLKIAGFKTLMAGPGDRDWANGEATSLKNKTSRFHNFDDLSPFGASRVAQAGEQSHKSKKKNRKSSGTLTGKFTDEKRSRNVGFESYVTEYNHKKTTTKALQGQQQSRYNSIDGFYEKNKEFYEEQQKKLDEFEDQIKDRSYSQRKRLRSKMMREMYNQKLNHIFLSNDHRANFYKG